MMLNNRDFAEDMTAVYIAYGPFDKVQYPINLTIDQKYEDIEVIGLSARSNNALKRNKIETVGQLSDAINKVEKMRGCGETVTREIKNSFLRWYYSEIESTKVPEFWMQFADLNGIRR